LRSSSAAPFPATTFVVHTTPASAKKQLVGIKIELRHCSILSSIQRAVASQSLCCQTNQPAQQRSTRVPFARRWLLPIITFLIYGPQTSHSHLTLWLNSAKGSVISRRLQTPLRVMFLTYNTIILILNYSMILAI
jgi:hypothetical protein